MNSIRVPLIDLPYRGRHRTLNLSRLNSSPVGVMWKLEEGVPAEASSSSLDHGLNLRGPSPIALVQLNIATFI
ncbi:hypothetical protein TNCV_4498741 [Trichonephila clavipes]|nr:hypothetical protein TNCV_4498741 [Trichonephila clavipes]